MVSSLFKLFPLSRHSIRAPVPQNLHFFRLNFLSTSSKDSSSESAGNNEGKKQLYTVKYLTTTFGFSPERAHASSKRFNFEKPDKPDSVISFLHNHGLTKAQISNMAKRYPPLVLSDPEKILLPKIEFFKSLGFSKKDVASIVFAVPGILHRSLEKHLIPSVQFLKGLFQSDDGLLASLKCHDNRILWVDLETTFIPNIDYLKELGVPQSNIMYMLKTQPRTFSQTHDHFRMIVDHVKKMRVNPEKYVFLLAIHVLVSMSKETWEKKMKVYIHWGFSEDEIFEAFRKHPHIMAHSTDKVTDLMNYLVNEMGFKSSIVIKRPQLLGLSLQKRIIPRCSVYRILSEKSLIPENLSIRYLLEIPEKKFLNKYVLPFEAQAPELLNLYNKYCLV